MKLRKVLASAMAVVMAVGAIVVAPVNADAADQKKVDISTGLISYYTFDDTLANSAKEDSTATLNKGEAVYSDNAVSGKAFDFAANAGTSTLANAAVAINLEVLPTTTAFTLNMWVYSAHNADGTSIPGTYAFFDGCCQYYQFRSNGDGAFPASRACMDDDWAWDTEDPKEIDHWRTGKDTQKAETWQMVTYTVSETGKATVYVDGVEVATYWDEPNYTEDAWFAYTLDEGATYQNMFTDDSASVNWTDVGILGSGDWWSENFAGLMDNVSMYERALTADDVAALYATKGNPSGEILTTAITLSETAQALVVGGTATLTVTGFEPAAVTTLPTVTWSSSNEEVATVADGVVTAVAAGTATITAAVSDTVKATCEITVANEEKPLTAISAAADKTELKINGTATITVTYDPVDTTDDKAVTWSSDNEEVATVKNGVVTAVGYGEATITAKVGELTATVKITVPTIPATAIEATANKTELTVGDKATITTTVTPTNTSDAVTYTSSDEKIVTVKEGVVTAVAEGTAKVTVTAGSVSKELTFTVKAPVVEEPETNTEADSETKTETDTETKTETKTETTTTKLDDLACDGFWGAHTAGIEIKAGTKYVVTFDAKSTDSTQAWFCPVYVVYSNSEAKVDNASADYKEYFVCRGDNWGWTADGDTGAGTLGEGYAFENLAVPEGDDWVAAFKEAVAAGAKGTLSAELSGKNLVITFAVGGVESKATVPVDTSKAVYISLTGEKTNLSNIEVKASKEVKVETKVEKVVTDLGDLACDAFWGAHTAGVEIKAGTDYVFEFDAKSTDATQAWFCPVYVVYTNSAAKVDNASADYKEYLVCRGDNWAWTTNGDSGAGTLGEGYAFENLAVPEADDWVAAFKEAVAAGAKGTIKAKLSGNNLVITFSVGGVESKATVPVDASKPVYISLTGEKCNLTDITATATTIVKKGDIVNPVLPIALVILGGAVVIVASKKRFA